MELGAERIDGSRDDIGRDPLTLRKEDQQIDDLSGRHGDEAWCFVLNALPCLW
jgi:hypothetical protein